MYRDLGEKQIGLYQPVQRSQSTRMGSGLGLIFCFKRRYRSGLDEAKAVYLTMVDLLLGVRRCCSRRNLPGKIAELCLYLLDRRKATQQNGRDRVVKRFKKRDLQQVPPSHGRTVEGCV